MRFLIDVLSHGRRVGGNRGRARKWYQRNQDLEVETESQLIESGSRGASLGICTGLLHYIF